MNEAYVEWLVKRKTPGYNYLLKGLLAFVCVLAFLIAMTTPFGFIVLLAVVVAMYFIWPMFSVEYEYLIVNDQISVDKIMGQTRRKKVWEAVLEDIELIGPRDAYQVKDLQKQGMKVLDFTSREPNKRVYAIMQQKAGETTQILFEPNDRILDHLRQRAPRKVIL